MKDHYIVLIVLICGTPILLGNGYGINKSFNHDPCSYDEDCPLTEKCYAEKCVSSCSNKTCGVNEGCQVNNDHTSTCRCLPDAYRYNIDDPCELSRLCAGPHKCHPNEVCTRNNDISSTMFCHCLSNVYFNATSRRCEFSRTCSHNQDCHLTHECYAGYCVSSCFNRTCGLNEICKVNTDNSSSCDCVLNAYRNTGTGQCILHRECYRSKDCLSNEECKENYDYIVSSCDCVSDAYRNTITGRCELNRTCSQNQDCHLTHKCYAGKCVSSCYNRTCGLNERCKEYTDHSSSCDCVPNAYRNTGTGRCELTYKWEKLMDYYDSFDEFAIIHYLPDFSRVYVVGRYIMDTNYIRAQLMSLKLHDSEYIFDPNLSISGDGFEVFRSNNSLFRWTRTLAANAIPDNAIELGKHGSETVYICRVKYKGFSYLGTVRPRDTEFGRICNWNFGSEIAYEILTPF